MRKYFLLSAVAILTATNANAYDDAYQATIEVAAKITSIENATCSTMNFGDILIDKQNFKGGSVTFTGYQEVSKSEGIVKVIGATAALCSSISSADTILEQQTVSLSGTGDGVINNLTLSNLTVMNSGDERGAIGGTLNIPEEFADGEYTGSFTVLTVYEV